MKLPVRQFKSMEVALKELAPFVRDPRHLQSGKPFKNFGGMLPREAWANWLVCVAVSSTSDMDLTFTTTIDPVGGDGNIVDKKTGEVFPTEHVMVSQHGAEGKDSQTLILDAIARKQAKGGLAYASGKTLVVFTDSDTGEWFPKRVVKALPTPLDFDAVWVVGFQSVKEGSYIYGVTLLDVSQGIAPICIVRIAEDFGSWEVTQIQ